LKAPCTRTIGGILRENDFSDFLGKYHCRKLADDPIREALGILGAAKPGQALRPIEWARVAVGEGLLKTVISNHERDTEKGRERAIGFLLSRQLVETREATTETRRLPLRLEGGFRRWDMGRNPHTRYVFTVIEEESLLVDD
jgi:hypothetical protein